LREGGTTILLVSHDVSFIQELCDKALWLQAGRIVAEGPAAAISQEYTEKMTPKAEPAASTEASAVRTDGGVELRINKNRFGSMEIEITRVRLVGRDGLPRSELESNDLLRIEIDYLSPHLVTSPIFNVSITREDGLVCFDANTDVAELMLPPVQGPGRIALDIERLSLEDGRYHVDIGVFERNWSYAYDYHWDAYPLRVLAATGQKSVARPTGRWELPKTFAFAVSEPAHQMSELG
jgi:homopolymeric O-antigen transport system ATP-binding protein